MAGQPSNVGAGIGLDAKTGRATQTARTTYLALCTTAPVDSDTMTTLAAKEVTTSGYSRQSVTWSAPTGDPMTTANTNAINFGTFTADPPNVPYIALVSSASGTTGDFIHYWTLDLARDGVAGDAITLAAGALTMSED